MRDARRARAVTVGIVAGEASGDALAATLIHAVRARLPGVRFVGIAGPKMEAAGCEAWYPLEKLSRARIRRGVGAPAGARFASAASCAGGCSPSACRVFVGVDAPDFNLGLERKLKRRGVRTVHFVSPSVWAWRRERLHTIGRSVDRMLALFPFEPPLYEEAGIPVTYVGHPMAQDAATHATRRETRELLKLGFATPVFALLPGSRMSEIDMHADLVLDTAARLVRGARRRALPRAVRDARRRATRSRPRCTGAARRTCRSRCSTATRRTRCARPTSASSRRGPRRSRRRSRAART